MGTSASTTATTALAAGKFLNTIHKTDSIKDSYCVTKNCQANSQNMNKNDLNEHGDFKSKTKIKSVKKDDKSKESKREENKKNQSSSEKLQKKTITLKEYHTQSVEALHKAIKIMKTLQSVSDDNGKIHSKIVNLIKLISELYWIPENVDVQPKDIENHRIDIANIFVNDKIIQTIYDVLNCFQKAGIVMSTIMFAIYRTCLGIIQNYTDKFENVCNEICMTDGFVEMFKTILVESKESYLKNTKTEQMHTIVSRILSIMHNITMRDSCITRIRHIGFTEVIQAYLMSEDNKVKLYSLSILAPIIEEKDKEIISANTGTVLLLLDYLKNGLDEKMRRYNGWSCTECALVTRYLSANDDNKEILVDAGCLALLVKFGKSAVDDDEKLESVGAIWALAFDQDIRKAMLSDKKLAVVDLLLKLKDSDNQRLKQTCAGALWTIREEHKTSNTKETSDVNNTKPNDGHIMISYQWDDQKTVIKIRDCLENAGLKVWIDINEMKGSITTAMAGAVENANVFLMCMSQKYQNSLNCQLEADYASTLTKTILPLKLERDYKPRSWTGLLCGSQKYYEFTGKYKFDLKMKELLRDMAQTKTNNGSLKALDHHPLSTAPEDVRDSVPVAMATSISYSGHVSGIILDTIRGWTQDDVDKWIERKNLKSCGINKRTGEEIALFITMRTENSEYFYKCLETMWNVKDSPTLSKIVWALKDLANELEQK